MKKPNVLLIYPDQMRYDCTSVAGNPTVMTPAIDRLAGEGVAFTKAYTSFPLCCPFRASLMTGCYAHTTGMYTNHYPIRLGQTFLPELMNNAGYRTGWFGKWHLNGGAKYDFVPKEYRLGFETFVGFSRGHNYLRGIYYRDDDPQPYKSEKYEPEYQTDHVIDFMAESLAQEKPFMAMICYGLPHSPVDAAPDHYKHMYEPEEVKLPDTVPEAIRVAEASYRAMYYGLVTCVDDQVERLMGWLRKSGVEDDTIVIFVSDHGDMNGEYGLHFKSSYYEASMHVPCIVRYPRLIAKGRIESHLVDPSVDLMPTILDLCSVPIPSSVEGKSWKRLLVEGDSSGLNDHILFQLTKVSDDACKVLDYQEHKRYAERGIRTDRYLYIEKSNVPFALYDLENDPGERYNCIDNVDHVNLIESLRSTLRTVMDAVHDDWSAGAIEPPPEYQDHQESRKWMSDLHERAKLEVKS